ncbi:MAG: HAMP domain-containing histidine kinase [Defluviitaleaceae bacterium]|nr:HAMP domain-containing histidine kinase [Defluviitaleaceae bacterium]
MKNIRRRFIFFNILVIASVGAIALLFMQHGSHISTGRMILAVGVVLLAVYIGSLLLSKIAIRPIQKAWQKQLDFMADASHELRTPITIIQTNLDLVMDEGEATVESQMKWLKNIEAESKRMAKLVEDLLTLSRADAGEPTLEKESFMLDEAILEVATPFEAKVIEKGLELNLDLGEKVNFYGDRKRIEQACLILLDNALSYTDSGQINVHLNKGDKNIFITIKDTGHGIEDEHMGKIFDRFYRVSKTKQLHQDGSGLGLSIAKWIVEEHGGQINVTSTLGEGTTFTIHLPL